MKMKRIFIYYESGAGVTSVFNFNASGDRVDKAMAVIQRAILKGDLFTVTGDDGKVTAIPGSRIFYVEVKDA